MSVRHKCLLIDVGNSRIKYALIAAPEELIVPQYCQQVSELAPLLSDCAKVLVACVGKQSIVDELNELCLQHAVSCQLIVTQQHQFGIHCAYQQYQNLGIDRWLAVLAARKITDLPVAVLDLGTANTCDFVVGNQHLGGWIAPGYHTMKKSLLAQTQKVFADDQISSQLVIGVSTPECVNYGCLAAVHGFVENAEYFLSQQAENYQIFITGGDQNLLLAKKNNKMAFFSNLVLSGLSRFF